MSKRLFWWVLFIGYCGFIVWMTLLDRPVTIRQYELRPFWVLQELAVGGSEGVKGIVWYIENILLFVPFGFLLFARNMKIKSVVLIGLIISLGIEIVQYVTAIGLAELDDLTANTLGAAIGVLLWRLLKKVVESHKKKGN